MAWLVGQITGHQEICGLGFFKVGLGPDRWIIRKFRLLGTTVEAISRCVV